MRNDDSVVVLGEDVGVNGGVFRATQGLQEQFGEERVIDTPLDEGTIAGLTVGLAVQGMKPVAEAQFEGFIYPMMEHIACHAARMRNRTRGRMTVPAVWRAPWGGGIRAPEHHSEANEHLFTNIPGLRVVMPSSPARAYGLLLAAIRDPDPVIFFEPKRIYRQYKEEVPDDGEALPLDVCFVLRDGTDVTLVTWGAQVKECLEAADELAEKGISAEVIDVATLTPLDFDTIAESVTKTGRCVIVHEAPKTAGFGAEIAARLSEECLYSLLAPVERVTGFDTHIPLFRLEMKYLPSHMADIKTFYLPDLGEGLPDATVVEWHVKEGDTIKLDAPLVSMETAKAVVDVPSPYSGTVKKLHGAAGDIIETGSALADFEIDPNARQRAEAESTGHHHGPKKGVGSPAADDASKVVASDDGGEIDPPKAKADREDEGTVVGAMVSGNAVHTEQVSSAGGVKAVPAVRAAAKKLKVDLARVQATGAGGVITMQDVKNAAANGSAQIGAAPARPASAQHLAPTLPEPGPAPQQRTAVSLAGKPVRTAPPGAEAMGQPEQLKGVRRNMARVMAEAHANVVPTSIVDDADLHAWIGKQD
ncbi:hypothetical protein KCV01_g10664, partial [Aureobasidium melanogenum]